MTNILPATDNVSLELRVTQDGGSTYKAGATDYADSSQGSIDGAATVAAGGESTGITLMGGLSNSAAKASCAEMRFWTPASTTVNKVFKSITVIQPTGSSFLQDQTASGVFKLNQAAINGIRFLMSSGNITSGVFALYGVRKT